MAAAQSRSAFRIKTLETSTGGGALFMENMRPVLVAAAGKEI